MGNLLAFNFGMHDEAKLLYERTTKLDPLTANNFFFLGVCNIQTGNNENAIKNFETAIRLEPDYMMGLDALAYLYASTANWINQRK
jgi:tetratricopeptide (TPR) repeat protein